ncbi:hypothetical protein AB1Y20_018473 [Prymnesium parvum]|uniref:Uncharacterized protein n=1 Tax=Prymnesium parvum TaxID=97485 RepID=A0AB34JNX8_PRYPA
MAPCGDHPPPGIARPAPRAATPHPPVAVRPTAGSAAFIAREHWPDEQCLEHGGAGWTVIVRSVSQHTAVVDFPHARAPSGAPFAPTRVPLYMLRMQP